MLNFLRLMKAQDNVTSADLCLIIAIAATFVVSVFAPLNYNIHIFVLGVCAVFLVSITKASQIEFNQYALFVTWVIVASCVNGVVSYRLGLWVVFFCALTPIATSKYLCRLRSKVLLFFLFSLPFVSLAAFLCYIVGYNYYLIIKEDTSELDFSAFMVSPMWLSALCGLANIVALWKLMTSRKLWVRLVYAMLLGVSFYTGIVSASRSALMSSAIAMIFVFFMSDLRKDIKFALVIAVLASAVVFSGNLTDGAERMLAKNESSVDAKFGSRTGVYEIQFETIKYSPIFGCGHSSRYMGGKIVTSRMESGSGWFAVMSQTGFVGFALLFTILPNISRAFHASLNNRHVLLVFSVFIYLCCHSCFEGYIMTYGYYLCAVFWLSVGFLSKKNLDCLSREKLLPC